jgi:hypothetical protein
MDRLAVLRDDGSQNEQVLETDIMRFMAIIGLVFWIVFSMIKSLPFQEAESRSSVARPKQEDPTASPLPQTVIMPESAEDKNRATPAKKKEVDSARQEPLEDPDPLDVESRTAESDDPVKSASSPMQGILMQFRSLEDLMALMKKGSVRVFCRAQATGFDLFFEGTPLATSVHFKGVSRPPDILWEIKTGKDRRHFLRQLAEAYPSVRSFPTRQVFILFVDTHLENQISGTIERLQQEGQNGTLSVTAGGRLEFDAVRTEPRGQAKEQDAPGDRR